MDQYHRFEHIQAWQLGKRIAVEVYRLTDESALRRDFVLRDQLRRAALSISSNIAEGHERDGNPEMIHFLSIAKASAGEVRSILKVALEAEIIDKETCTRLIKLCYRTSGAIEALRKQISNSRHRDRKFK